MDWLDGHFKGGGATVLSFKIDVFVHLSVCLSVYVCLYTQCFIKTDPFLFS